MKNNIKKRDVCYAVLCHFLLSGAAQLLLSFIVNCLKIVLKINKEENKCWSNLSCNKYVHISQIKIFFPCITNSDMQRCVEQRQGVSSCKVEDASQVVKNNEGQSCHYAQTLFSKFSKVAIFTDRNCFRVNNIVQLYEIIYVFIDIQLHVNGARSFLLLL